MSLNFLDIKAKQQAKEFTFTVYQPDFERFSKFVDFINRNKSPDETVSPEDVFEEIMKVTDELEGFSEYLSTRKGAKRGRKKEQ